MAGKPFFNGMTKTQLQKQVREIVNSQEFNRAFESDLISDLIVTHHYYCSVHKLRPSKLMKQYRPGGGYDFMGWFGDRWHLVSWTVCLTNTGGTESKAWLVRGLRDFARQFVGPYKARHPHCERCGDPAVEVDHCEPEFKVIADAALAELSEKDIENAVASFDWWSEETHRLPPDSPALRVVAEMHKTAILMSVCKACHLKNAAGRK